LRLDPDDLRRDVPLIQSGKRLWFQNERGEGLASLYDALQSRDVDSFLRIRSRFIELFPTVRTLRLVNPTSSTKALGLTLANGSEVTAAGMSEGMLYWLAFAIIESLEPQAILLIEEPENGLHPSRIVDVMRIFREVSARTQIVLATHSPLVINELKPEEVTIVTRTPEAGTICTPMTATKNFAERSKVYALGELWLSYADGDLERELVEPGKDAAKAS
jgi:predicted ATPase